MELPGGEMKFNLSEHIILGEAAIAAPSKHSFWTAFCLHLKKVLPLSWILTHNADCNLTHHNKRHKIQNLLRRDFCLTLRRGVVQDGGRSC